LTAFNQVSNPPFDEVSSHSSRSSAESRLKNYVDLAYQLKEVEDALNATDDPEHQFILHDYMVDCKINPNSVRINFTIYQITLFYKNTTNF